MIQSLCQIFTMSNRKNRKRDKKYQKNENNTTRKSVLEITSIQHNKFVTMIVFFNEFVTMTYRLMNLLQRCISSKFATMIVFHTDNTISKKRVYWSRRKTHIRQIRKIVESRKKIINQSRKTNSCKKYWLFRHNNRFDFSTKFSRNRKIRICILCIDVCSLFAISIIFRLFYSIDTFFELVTIKLYERKVNQIVMLNKISEIFTKNQ